MSATAWTLAQSQLSRGTEPAITWFSRPDILGFLGSRTSWGTSQTRYESPATLVTSEHLGVAVSFHSFRNFPGDSNVLPRVTSPCREQLRPSRRQRVGKAVGWPAGSGSAFTQPSGHSHSQVSEPRSTSGWGRWPTVLPSLTEAYFYPK